MSNRDTTPLLAPGDLAAALGLLSRLPLPVDAGRAQARGAAAAWAYPVAGFVIAVAQALAGAVALALGLGPGISAGIVLAAGALLTGAMHEDGLADTADGLWGGWTRDRRLEIMKDSRIGVYGVLALVLSVLLRWQALSLVIAGGLLWPALIAAGMLGRAAMVVLMGALPLARPGGLSRSVGQPGRATVALAAALAALGALVLGGWGLVLILVALLATAAMATLARVKIGGQTGDILGATGQMVELSVFLTLAALLAS